MFPGAFCKIVGNLSTLLLTHHFKMTISMPKSILHCQSPYAQLKKLTEHQKAVTNDSTESVSLDQFCEPWL